MILAGIETALEITIFLWLNQTFERRPLSSFNF